MRKSDNESGQCERRRERTKPNAAPRESEQDSDAELRRKQAAADLMVALVDSFDGHMPRIPISIAYRIGALFVAIIMILIPIFYIGLVLGACYLIYYHAVEHVVIFKTWRHWYLAILVYVVPLLAGIILVVFMFKPLFARPLPRGKCRSLDKNKQPLLHEFVEHVCTVVGAPVPRQLDVDLQVNASAGFRRGMWSLFGNDLVLTIGLPLVAGLNVQQLAGVLAHEMGHFAQGAGLRLTYIVRSINEWLFRAVNEHDEWDDTLIAWSESSEYLGIILALAMVFISITRRILFLLLVVAHGISCFQLRQMEYHADQYEIHLAGSKAFKTTSRRLTRLEIGVEIA